MWHHLEKIHQASPSGLLVIKHTDQDPIHPPWWGKGRQQLPLVFCPGLSFLALSRCGWSAWRQPPGPSSTCPVVFIAYFSPTHRFLLSWLFLLYHRFPTSGLRIVTGPVPGRGLRRHPQDSTRILTPYQFESGTTSGPGLFPVPRPVLHRYHVRCLVRVPCDRTDLPFKFNRRILVRVVMRDKFIESSIRFLKSHSYNFWLFSYSL